MIIKTDPLVCDITVLNDLRAFLYESLSNRDTILDNPQELRTLPSRKLAVSALQRLNGFFTSAIENHCAYAYPTLLYWPAEQNCEDHGYHFSVPPVVYISETEPVILRNQRINLHVKKLKLDISESENAGYELYFQYRKTFERKSEKILRYMDGLLKSAKQDKEDTFQQWHKSKLVTIHTHMVADTSWDNHKDACTPLQQKIVDSCVKQSTLPADRAYEIIPRGLSYFFAALGKDKGLCHTFERDFLLRFFYHRNWTKIAETLLYSEKQLIDRLDEAVLSILCDCTKEKDVELSKYCLDAPAYHNNGNPDIQSIDKDKVEEIVTSWEANAWRYLLRNVLCRTDLRQNRIKTLIYDFGKKKLGRLTVTNINRFLKSWIMDNDDSQNIT